MADAPPGRAQALDVLRRCIAPAGFKASAFEGGYPQVWARDAGITALGALVTGDTELVDCTRASLETLGAHQTDLGMIHLNVDTRTGDVTTENAGAVDANLWFIVAHDAYRQHTGDLEFTRGAWPRLLAAALWLRYQDMNACGLLEVPEAGDWADLYSVRYNVLYDNVLWVGALRAMAAMAEALAEDGSAYRTRAGEVARRIDLLMWLDRPWDGTTFGAQLEELKALRLEWFLLYQNTATLTEMPYYLPWTGFREFGTTFDAFGNSLAILLGVADEQKRERILTHAHAVGADDPFPVKAFYPPIHPGDRDWREYYRSRNLNLPNQYHNGGIWPFLGGFFVAALVSAGHHDRARRSLDLLAEANRAGKHGAWEFNEWLHGLSGRPMGHPQQAWSAAMYLYALDALERGEPAFFGGWRA
ncbi:MAG: glycogen debranching protein [Trueperaceae bacterium]|nr:glycogen debranching protein [Trueperaceae bacterium]